MNNGGLSKLGCCSEEKVAVCPEASERFMIPEIAAYRTGTILRSIKCIDKQGNILQGMKF